MVTIEMDEDGTRQRVHIATAQDLYDLRDRVDFHEGALAILRYPSANPIGMLSHDDPKAFGGLTVRVGDTIWKDQAGNFGYVE